LSWIEKIGNKGREILEKVIEK